MATCSGVCFGGDHATGCNGSSELTFHQINAGDEVVLKLAGFAPGDVGTGILTILDPTCDPCAQNTSFEPNDTCGEAIPIPQGIHTGLWISGSDEDHYSFCVGPGGTLAMGVAFQHALGDVDLQLFDASTMDCENLSGALDFSNSVTDMESIQWVNSTGSDMNVILRVFQFASASGCQNYDLINSSDSCNDDGTPFCSPGVANSTGLPAELTGVVDAIYPGAGLHLDVSQGPAGEIGYFLVGLGVSEPGITLGNGKLCLSVALGRYNVANTNRNSLGFFNVAGVLENLAGTSSAPGNTGFDVPSTLPLTGSPTIMAGQSFHFQAWFRDTPAGVGQSNLTNGLSVQF